MTEKRVGMEQFLEYTDQFGFPESIESLRLDKEDWKLAHVTAFNMDTDDLLDDREEYLALVTNTVTDTMPYETFFYIIISNWDITLDQFDIIGRGETHYFFEHTIPVGEVNGKPCYLGIDDNDHFYIPSYEKDEEDSE